MIIYQLHVTYTESHIQEALRGVNISLISQRNCVEFAGVAWFLIGVSMETADFKEIGHYFTYFPLTALHNMSSPIFRVLETVLANRKGTHRLHLSYLGNLSQIFQGQISVPCSKNASENYSVV